MKTCLLLLFFVLLSHAENTKHVFWCKCIQNNYSLSDSAEGKGPNIQSEVVKHEGKALTATIRGSAGNQDPTITLGNGLDNAQARSFVIWYKDLCDMKLTEGAKLISAKFRGEFKDSWVLSAPPNAGPIKPRVGVVSMDGHFLALNTTPATHPDNAIWSNTLNPLGSTMGYLQPGDSFRAQEILNLTVPSGGTGSTYQTLEGKFFEIDFTKQVQYILSNSGQLGIAAITTAGDGSTGKILAYAFEDGINISLPYAPWTHDGNTAHLLLEIENGSLEYKPGSSSEIISINNSATVLSANPNPFKHATSILFNCGNKNYGNIKIFDANGKIMLNKSIIGSGSLMWNTASLPSAVYLCRLETESKTISLRLLLAK